MCAHDVFKLYDVVKFPVTLLRTVKAGAGVRCKCRIYIAQNMLACLGEHYILQKSFKILTLNHCLCVLCAADVLINFSNELWSPSTAFILISVCCRYVGNCKEEIVCKWVAGYVGG